MARISEGSKAANQFLKDQGKTPEWHDGASIANILVSYPNPINHRPQRVKEVGKYLRSIHMSSLEDEIVEQLVDHVQKAMESGR